jgi:hypothetical protein
VVNAKIKGKLITERSAHALFLRKGKNEFDVRGFIVINFDS